jgi:hypothetical protein
MWTSFHHQPEAQHPKSSAFHKLAGRLPHLLGRDRTTPTPPWSQCRHGDRDPGRSPQEGSPRRVIAAANGASVNCDRPASGPPSGYEQLVSWVPSQSWDPTLCRRYGCSRVSPAAVASSLAVSDAAAGTAPVGAGVFSSPLFKCFRDDQPLISHHA